MITLLLNIAFVLTMVILLVLYAFALMFGVTIITNILDERIDKDNMEEKEIKQAKIDSYFPGEMWARCPYCDSANEMVGAVPVEKHKGYAVYSCEKCGGLFRVR